MSSLLATPIEFLKGVGPQKGELIKKELAISTFNDLLHYYPFRYVDRSMIHTVKEINQNSQYIQLKGIITGFKLLGEKRTKRLVAQFQDKTGTIELVWFQGADWFLKSLTVNMKYVIFGKPTIFNNNYNIPHPEIEIVTLQHTQQGRGLQPIYSTSEKARKRFLDSKGIEKLTRQLLDILKENDLREFLPAPVLQQQKLFSRAKTYTNIHFPQSENILQDAIYRIKFEEFFLIQLRLLKIKFNYGKTVRGFIFEKIDNHFDNFYKTKLPFELTNAQKRVLKEIRKDTLNGKQMNRLLQGDVGSGKTVVALLTMLMGIDNNFQACLMAPTEILAQQHFEGISKLLQGTGIEVALLTGSVKGKKRTYILNHLLEGTIRIVIGTHALIEKPVQFKNIGMVVIDEQHRFGVEQRAKLWTKNVKPPHVLVMTATPIPRTLAMTLYGDLDISIIDELPPGRKPIKTVHRNDSDRLRVFGFVRDQVAEGRQIYFVYPMIEESETLDLKNLMEGYESISRAFPLPNYRIGILHGKMKPADKDYEMQRFAKGETQILVATTVIEVGVNVPNASVMVIENAERFGLSQLHQLRGRVGRGASQSFCILMSGGKLSYPSKKRIEVLCQTNDGFIIAEEDLKLRGSGDLDGTRQSGAVNFKLANLAEDGHILEVARREAFELLDKDPELSQTENIPLREYVSVLTKDNVWSKIS